ncbi:MAG: DEAD/DEAH box helicase [Pseudomonadota bacterium]
MTLTLSAEQSALIEYALARRANLFITGPAGTGKTTVTRAILNAAPGAAVLAPTGVAAMQAGGQTLHSFFRLPPRLITPADIRRLRGARALKALRTLVIDEISMVRADLMEAIDQTLRLNRDNPEPFGGVQMIVVGDLAQLPPVVQGEEAAFLEHQFGGPFFFNAPAFREAGFVMAELAEIHRQNDPDFVELLNAVREAHLSSHQLELLQSRVTGRTGLEASETHVVLTGTNAAAQSINAKRLAELPGDTYAFAAKLEGAFEPKLFPTEEPLLLKHGARVMLLKNDATGRWVNGTLATVTDLSGGEVRVRIAGETHTVEPQKWERNRYAVDPKTNALSKEVTGGFTQLPLRLAWATTIHKAQGLTLDRVFLDVSRPLFAHGQAYVALSRARTLEGLELSRSLRPNDIVVDQRLFDVRSFCDPAPPELASY